MFVMVCYFEIRKMKKKITYSLTSFYILGIGLKLSSFAIFYLDIYHVSGVFVNYSVSIFIFQLIVKEASNQREVSGF